MAGAGNRQLPADFSSNESLEYNLSEANGTKSLLIQNLIGSVTELKHDNESNNYALPRNENKSIETTTVADYNTPERSNKENVILQFDNKDSGKFVAVKLQLVSDSEIPDVAIDPVVLAPDSLAPFEVKTPSSSLKKLLLNNRNHVARDPIVQADIDRTVCVPETVSFEMNNYSIDKDADTTERSDRLSSLNANSTTLPNDTSFKQPKDEASETESCKTNNSVTADNTTYAVNSELKNMKKAPIDSHTEETKTIYVQNKIFEMSVQREMNPLSEPLSPVFNHIAVISESSPRSVISDAKDSKPQTVSLYAAYCTKPYSQFTPREKFPSLYAHMDRTKANLRDQMEQTVSDEIISSPSVLAGQPEYLSNVKDKQYSQLEVPLVRKAKQQHQNPVQNEIPPTRRSASRTISQFFKVDENKNKQVTVTKDRMNIVSHMKSERNLNQKISVENFDIGDNASDEYHNNQISLNDETIYVANCENNCRNEAEVNDLIEDGTLRTLACDLNGTLAPGLMLTQYDSLPQNNCVESFNCKQYCNTIAKSTDKCKDITSQHDISLQSNQRQCTVEPELLFNDSIDIVDLNTTRKQRKTVGRNDKPNSKTSCLKKMRSDDVFSNDFLDVTSNSQSVFDNEIVCYGNKNDNSPRNDGKCDKGSVEESIIHDDTFNRYFMLFPCIIYYNAYVSIFYLNTTFTILLIVTFSWMLFINFFAARFSLICCAVNVRNK